MEKSSADAMFASAGDVLGTLVDRAVTAAACDETSESNSIRVEPDTVATLTELPLMAS